MRNSENLSNEIDKLIKKLDADPWVVDQLSAKDLEQEVAETNINIERLVASVQTRVNRAKRNLGTSNVVEFPPHHIDTMVRSGWLRRTGIAACAIIFLAAAGFILHYLYQIANNSLNTSSGPKIASTTEVERDFAVPPRVAEAIPEVPGSFSRVERKMKIELPENGNLISSLLAAGIPAADANLAVNYLLQEQSFDPYRMVIGQEINVVAEYTGDIPVRLSQIELMTAFGHTIKVQRTGDEYRVTKDLAPQIMMPVYRSGKVMSNLFDATTQAGVPASIFQEMESIFSQSVNLKRMQAGATFEVLFERYVAAGETRDGRLLYVSLNTGKRKQKFYRFEPRPGIAEYFDDDGTSVRKVISKSPVRDQKARRAAQRTEDGVWEFWSYSNLEVIATGDGLIEEIRKDALGDFLVIRHTADLTSRYRYILAGADTKVGQWVRRGEVVGTAMSQDNSKRILLYDLITKGRGVDEKTEVDYRVVLEGNLSERFKQSKAIIEQKVQVARIESEQGGVARSLQTPVDHCVAAPSATKAVLVSATCSQFVISR